MAGKTKKALTAKDFDIVLSDKIRKMVRKEMRSLVQFELAEMVGRAVKVEVDRQIDTQEIDIDDYIEQALDSATDHMCYDKVVKARIRKALINSCDKRVEMWVKENLDLNEYFEEFTDELVDRVAVNFNAKIGTPIVKRVEHAGNTMARDFKNTLVNLEKEIKDGIKKNKQETKTKRTAKKAQARSQALL